MTGRLSNLEASNLHRMHAAAFPDLDKRYGDWENSIFLNGVTLGQTQKEVYCDKEIKDGQTVALGVSFTDQDGNSRAVRVKSDGSMEQYDAVNGWQNIEEQKLRDQALEVIHQTFNETLRVRLPNNPAMNIALDNVALEEHKRVEKQIAGHEVTSAPLLTNPDAPNPNQVGTLEVNPDRGSFKASAQEATFRLC